MKQDIPRELFTSSSLGAEDDGVERREGLESTGRGKEVREEAMGGGTDGVDWELSWDREICIFWGLCGMTCQA